MSDKLITDIGLNVVPLEREPKYYVKEIPEPEPSPLMYDWDWNPSTCKWEVIAGTLEDWWVIECYPDYRSAWERYRQLRTRKVVAEFEEFKRRKWTAKHRLRST